MTIYINGFAFSANDFEIWAKGPVTPKLNAVRVNPDCNFTLPDGVTSVGYISLDSGATLTLPDGVTSVGDIRLYSGATLTLPDGVTSVGYIRLDSGATLTLPDGDNLPKVIGHEMPDRETARARLIEVAQHALRPGALNMQRWHNESRGCGTVHCIAGWAVSLAGKAGYDLEKKVGQPAAGNILLGVEASHLFYLNNHEARTALHKVLSDAGLEPLPA
jgi:hypothetical protein